MTFNPGRNRTLIEIYSRTETEEIQLESGEYDEVPKLIGKAWAEIISYSGKAYLEKRKTETELVHTLKVRDIVKIKNDDYIMMFGQKWEIEYISPPVSRYMQIVVKKDTEIKSR